ncbi:TPA: histidine kinase [Pseudomonas putida]
MHRLNILIVQSRPAQQIALHQACNALGVFNVRIACDLGGAEASMAQMHSLDMLIIDHGMPTLSARALLKHKPRHGDVRAVLFVGQPPVQGPDLAVEARRQGWWVVAQLPWPLSMRRLQAALQQLCRPPCAYSRQDIETVMLPTHAR